MLERSSKQIVKNGVKISVYLIFENLIIRNKGGINDLDNLKPICSIVIVPWVIDILLMIGIVNLNYDENFL